MIMELLLLAFTLKVIESVTKWDGMICISGCL
jgi:hypothetical protein